MIASLPRIFLGLAVLGLVAWWLRRRKRAEQQPSEPSRAPDLWDAMSEHFAELDRELEQAKHWSKAEVALAIEQYVFKLDHSSDDQEDLLRKLELQPEKTQSVALELLGDPALQTRLRREPRGEPALYRACQLLLLQPTTAAVPHLLLARVPHGEGDRHQQRQCEEQNERPATDQSELLILVARILRVLIDSRLPLD